MWITTGFRGAGTLLSTLVVGMLAACSTAPHPRPTTMNEMLDAELTAIADDHEHRLASLSVLAIRDGRIVYENQFGNRHIDNADPSKNKRANEQTMYRIASISKLVVALGMLRLVEEGKLALDADVSDYLGYRLRNPHFPDAPITLRTLLTHTSSLRDDADYFWPAKVALKDVLLPGGPLHGDGRMWAKNAPPGAYFAYCNLNSGVIASVMERVTGERFDKLMKRLVLDPLELRGGFNPAEFSPGELDDTATIYRKAKEVEGKYAWNPAGPWIAQVDDYSREPPAPRADASYVPGSNGSVFGPQGNLRISARGLARIALMLMNDGELGGKRFLERRMIDAMLSMQWRHDGDGTNGQRTFGTHRNLFNAWGLDAQIFLDIPGPGSGDRLVEGGGFPATGHLGEAYGLTGALAFNRETKNGLIYLVGGIAFDPDTYPGEYSALYRYEERILTTLYKRAILSDMR